MRHRLKKIHTAKKCMFLYRSNSKLLTAFPASFVFSARQPSLNVNVLASIVPYIYRMAMGSRDLLYS